MLYIEKLHQPHPHPHDCDILQIYIVFSSINIAELMNKVLDIAIVIVSKIFSDWILSSEIS